MAKSKSFGRAVYEGVIQGPDWPVVDEDGTLLQPSFADEWKASPLLNVSTAATSCVGKVVNYQPIVEITEA